jgi:hypothetical protein
VLNEMKTRMRVPYALRWVPIPSMSTLLHCPPSPKAEDIERFQAASGGLLDELGCSRAFPRLRSESLESASKIRNLLAQNLDQPTQSRVQVPAAPLGVRQ